MFDPGDSSMDAAASPGNPPRRRWFLLAGKIFPYLGVLGFLLTVASAVRMEAAEAEIGRKPEPSWVKALEVDLAATTPKEAGDGGIWHMLADMQEDSASHTRYRHFAYRFLSASGVQEYSEQSFEFNPAYQTLTIHRLRIHRNGEVIDRLASQEIKTLERESGHEEQLYDGRLTSVILLKDIRVGDVLEYAYSVKGQNPIFGDHFSTIQQWQWGSTVHHARFRVVWNQQVPLPYRIENSPAKPTVTTTENGQELVWEQYDSEPIHEEIGLPGDYTPYPWIDLSDFRSWDEVRRWALELYHYPSNLPPELERQLEVITRLPDDEQKALAALRYVQDSIRYVGSFMGEHSHKPYKIETIMDRRFGDCKDKALLLVALLRRMGIEASPALVDTNFRNQIKDRLPSPFAFDHVVTCLTLDGQTFWLDPTRRFQRGDSLEKIYFPDYGLALVLEEGGNGLTKIETPGLHNPKTEIHETFTFEDYRGEGKIAIKTEYHGRNADSMRAYFSSNSSDTIRESYLEYYSNDYPGVEPAAEISSEDDEDENRFTVSESYLVKDFWKREEGDSHWEGSFTPREVYNELYAPNRTDRKMPYGIDYPENVKHSINIILPSKWEDEEEGNVIDNPAFHYSYQTKSLGNKTDIVFHYTSKKSRVAAKDVAEYVKAIEQAKSVTGYTIIIPDSFRSYTAGELSAELSLEEGIEETPYSPHWLAIIIVMGTLLFGVLISTALYFWNPPPHPVVGLSPGRENLVGRGGWLVLVAIGVFIRPVFRMVSLGQGLFDLDLNVWNELTTSGNENYHILWGPTILGSLMADAIMLSLEILLIVLYIQLRTSFPKILTAELLYLFVETGILFSVFQVLPGLDHATKLETGKFVLQATIAVLIWVPYLTVSKRVRNTFVKRRGKRLTPPPLPPTSN